MARRLPVSLALVAILAVSGFGAGCAFSPAPSPAAKPAPVPPPARNLFVLLADAGGTTGKITVKNDAGERLLSRPGQAVIVASLAADPGEPRVLGAEEIRTLFGPALAAMPPAPDHFIIYFKTGSTELTDESLARMSEVALVIRERGSTDVSVVGHADTQGDKQYNYELSLKRARAVADLITTMGVAPNILDIASHGKDNPLVLTGDQVAEPKNRRVEITVR